MGGKPPRFAHVRVLLPCVRVIVIMLLDVRQASGLAVTADLWSSNDETFVHVKTKQNGRDDRGDWRLCASVGKMK